MAIFSTDVDNVRIIGTILIFVLSIIGACVPIAVARIWGLHHAKQHAKTGSTPDDVTPLSRAERRQARKDAALSYHKKQQTLKLIQHLFLALGAGVIVGTAVMHMLPEGSEAVSEGYEGLRSSGNASADEHAGHSHSRGFFAAEVVIAHREVFAVADDATTTEDHDHDHDHENETTHDHDHDHDHENETTHDHDHDHDHDHENETDHDHDHDHSEEDAHADEEGGHSHGFPFGYLFVLAGMFITFVVESEMHRALDSYDHPHSHDHSHDTVVAVSSLTPAEQRAELTYQRELSTARAFSAKAQLLELAVATHSVIIGVAFGALTSASSSDPLALALIFHQLCEGFAVGAIFEAAFRAPPVKPAVGADANAPAAPSSWFARNRHHLGLVLFICIFALSVPIGIIIGIGIAEGGSDPDGPTSLFVRGAFECFAGGVLLYVGCVEFLGGLFGAHSHSHVAAIPDDCSDAEAEAEEEAAKESADDEAVSTVHGIVVADDAPKEGAGAKVAAGDDDGCDHHHHNRGHPNGHFLETDSLFGRIATYTLVLIGGGVMSIIANWA